MVDLPAPVSLGDYLNSLFGVNAPAQVGAMSAEAPAFLVTAKQLLGPVAWRSVSRSLSGMMQLQHEPVLLLMPSAIVIR